MKTVKISNVGPVERLDIALQPGVNLLRGRNESGKSTAIRAVQALTDPSVQLKPRRGSEVGYVMAGKTIIEVGRKVKRGGYAEVESLSDPADLSALVNPGVEGEEAATRRRIKALLGITGQQITKDDFVEVLGDGGVVRDAVNSVVFSSDPLDNAAKVKRAIEAVARQQEAKVDQIKGRIEQIQKTLPELESGVAGLTVSQVSEELQALYMDLAKAKAERAAAEQATRKLQGLEVLAAQREAAEAEQQEAEQEHAASQQVAALCSMALQAAADRVKAAQEAYAAAKQSAEQAEADAVRSKAGAAKAAKRVKEIQSAAAEIESLRVEGPTDEQLEAIEQAIRDRTEVFAKVQKQQQAIKLREDMNEGVLEMAEAVKEAKRVREAAKSVYDVLSQRLAAPGIAIVDGVLMLNEPGRKQEPYAELSDGKRWQVAIRCAAQALQAQYAATPDETIVLAVAQEAWEGLDSHNRQIVHDTAIECGVAIVTAEHTDGELEVASI